MLLSNACPPTRMAAAMSISLFAVTLSVGLHQGAAASLVTQLMGAAKEYAAASESLVNAFPWRHSELQASPPSQFAGKQHASESEKGPTPWPEVFHAKFLVTVQDSTVIDHTFYDYPNRRMMNILIPPVPESVIPLLSKDVERRPENYGLSMQRTIRAFEQGRVKNGLVDSLDGRLFFPDTAFWMLLKPYSLITFSRNVPFCDERKAPGEVVPPPDVLGGAKYVGQEQVDGVNCDVYVKGSGPAPFQDKAFVTLYENAETGYPVKFVLFNGIEMMVESFEPNGTLDEADWEPPAYCEKDSPSRSPVSIDQ